MNATTYGDVAKRVFQLYWVEAQTGEIVNRRFGRGQDHRAHTHQLGRSLSMNMAAGRGS